MDERAIRIAEETRLRERAQHWAVELIRAQEIDSPLAAEFKVNYDRAVKEHDQFLSGFDDGEDT